jgi:hypothetical protein
VDERRDEKDERSWLDEISWSTKAVVVVTLLAVAGYVVLLIADLFG